MPDLELWFPGAVRDPCDPSLWGTYTDSGEPKFCLHTTEGNLGAYAPDPRLGQPARRYYGHTNWPTYTLAYDARRTWQVYQHMPANRAARALANRAGGVETNRDNVTQVEIACRAIEIAVFADTGGMDVLAELLAWEHVARGVPLVSSVRWVAYPASYGSGAGQRLPDAAWDAYTGVLGHMHAPENDHGDPGAFPIGLLLQRAREHLAPAYEEDELSPEDKTDLLRAIGAIPGNVWRTTPAEGVKQADMHGVVNESYRKLGAIQRPGLTGVAEQLGRIETAVSAPLVPLGDVTESAIHDALDHAVDAAAVARIVEHGGRALSALLTRPAVLPPSEAPS